MNACLLPVPWVDMVDPRVCNHWERGIASPQFDTVLKIACILQISLGKLVGRSLAVTEPKIHHVKLLHLYQQVTP